MDERRTRRRYLRALGVAGVAGFAGCLSSESDSRTGETPTGDTPTGDTPTRTPTSETPAGGNDDANTVPEWAEWVPAEVPKSEDGDFGVLDLSRARQAWPTDVYQSLKPTRIAEQYGIDDTSVERYIGAGGTETGSLSIMLGSFDQADITSDVLSQYDLSESAVETKWGFDIIPLIRFGVAVGESAVVVLGGDNDPLGAKFGEVASIGSADDDWRTLLSVLSGATHLGAGPVGERAELTTQPVLGGYAATAASGGGLDVTL